VLKQCIPGCQSLENRNERERRLQGWTGIRHMSDNPVSPVINLGRAAACRDQAKLYVEGIGRLGLI
jgi:carbon monoxide dehydrogenase subunit G